MPTLTMLSGGELDLENPKEDQFTLDDIATGLANTCRHGGQLRDFYSVAEHSVLAAVQAKKDGQPIPVQLACLFHDAAEGLLGIDVSTPIKIMVPDFKKLEASLMREIELKFRIDVEKHYVIYKEIDVALKFAERRRLRPKYDDSWMGVGRARLITPNIGPWSPKRARQRFLQVADCLFRKGKT